MAGWQGPSSSPDILSGADWPERSRTRIGRAPPACECVCDYSGLVKGPLTPLPARRVSSPIRTWWLRPKPVLRTLLALWRNLSGYCCQSCPDSRWLLDRHDAPDAQPYGCFDVA